MLKKTEFSGYITQKDAFLFDYCLLTARVFILKRKSLFYLYVTGYRPRRLCAAEYKASNRYIIQTSTNLLDLINDFCDLCAEVSCHFSLNRSNGFYEFLPTYNLEEFAE